MRNYAKKQLVRFGFYKSDFEKVVDVLSVYCPINVRSMTEDGYYDIYVVSLHVDQSRIGDCVRSIIELDRMGVEALNLYIG